MFFNNGISNMMFSIVPIIVLCIFVFIFILFIMIGIKAFGQRQYNNNQPVLIVLAKLISKRTNFSTSMHNDSDGIGNHHHSSTSYFITFEVESGSRMEFQINGDQFGLLLEGDTGKLKFQGTRYLGFERSLDE